MTFTARIPRWTGIAACAVLLAGCTAPTQYQGPIVIDPAGLAERLRQLCARRIAAGGQESTCNTAELDD